MIKISKRKIGVPVVTEMELAGQRFEIELLPTDDMQLFEDFKPFRKTKPVLNSYTKKMEQFTYLNEDDPAFLKVAEKRLLKIVNNFWGIAGNDGVELDGTKDENKLLLGSVQIEDTEDINVEDGAGGTAVIKQPRVRPFRTLIFEKAAELGKAVAEAEIKNSVTSQPGIVEQAAGS